MAQIEIENPFVVGKYVSDEYFCDREAETDFLKKQIVNGRNVALISERRMGKSGLIQHTFAQRDIQNGFNTFFIDIYATGSLPEFVYLLGKAVFEKLKPQKTRWFEDFFRIVESLRIGFKMDPVTGEPGLDIGIGDIKKPETTLDEIFLYLENSGKKNIVAIDEFQQIGEYPQKIVEALLRTKIQMCTTTQFIFAGSKKHMMSNMFHSPAKPFYQSVITMGLNPIPVEIYSLFAKELFEEKGKKLDVGVAEKVHETFCGTTWFVQMMMNELFSLTPAGGRCTEDMIETAMQNIIQVQEYSYREILANRLSARQKQMIQALARDRKATAITSAEFINRHRLGSASSVQAAIRPLIAEDLVTKDDDGYRISDYFFSEWLRRNF